MVVLSFRSSQHASVFRPVPYNRRFITELQFYRFGDDVTLRGVNYMQAMEEEEEVSVHCHAEAGSG